jgi:hypothetical protein
MPASSASHRFRYGLAASYGGSTPYARTGNVPTPRNLTGTAWNRKPDCGRAFKLQRCSTMEVWRFGRAW